MIMIKFKKDYNLRKIVSLALVIIFIIQSTAEGVSLSYKTYLRVPIITNNEDRKDRLKEGLLQTTISRRKFIKYIGLGLTISILPILIQGDQNKIIQAIEKIGKYTLSFDYLRSLTKREGSAYIRGIYYAVNANKINRNQAERFLRKIFNEEYLLWMRQVSIETLIKLDMIKETELEELITSVPDEPVLASIASAFSEKDTSRAAIFLIRWLERERNSPVRAAIITTLGEIGREEQKVEEYLIELSKRAAGDYMTSEMALMYALGEIGTEKAKQRIEEWGIGEPEWWYLRGAQQIALKSIELESYSVEELIKLLDAKQKYLESIATIRILKDKAIKDGKEKIAVDCLIKLTFLGERSLGPMGDFGIEQEVISALGSLATKEAIDYLIKASRIQENDFILSWIASALAMIGDRQATDYLTDWDERESLILPAWQHGEVYSGEAVISLINSIRESDESNKSTYRLFAACGFKSIEILNNELKSTKLSDKQRERMQSFIKDIITNEIDSMFRNYINDIYNSSPQVGQGMIDAYFERLKDKPRTLFTILALSQEMTSHSFPVAYGHLKEHIIAKYGNLDVPRYISEEQKNMFLPEFLFTLTIFNELERCLQETIYSPKELADIMLSKDKIEPFYAKPSLFSKIISNILLLKNQDLNNAFLDKIIDLGRKDKRFKFFIKVLLESNVIQKEDRLSSFVLDTVLPEINPAWLGPQKSWLKNNVLSVGVYWSTNAESEKAHYEQFSDIFNNGAKVSAFYSNFKGYTDRSRDPFYKAKLKQNSAEKILVKEFPETGRSIEIYLYSSLDSIKKSAHSITISRGHAGTEGINDYPGLPGTLRVASHCRSINDSDNYIQVNPDSPIITIVGTAQAVETNPVLYYLFEYLGTEKAWSHWTDIKNYIAPHIPESVQGYNFPVDDIAFIYAVMLEKIKRQKTKKASFLGTNIGIIGILKSLKDQL
jgi:HEAT repeat protein